MVEKQKMNSRNTKDLKTLCVCTCVHICQYMQWMYINEGRREKKSINVSVFHSMWLDTFQIALARPRIGRQRESRREGRLEVRRVHTPWPRPFPTAAQRPFAIRCLPHRPGPLPAPCLHPLSFLPSFPALPCRPSELILGHVLWDDRCTWPQTGTVTHPQEPRAFWQCRVEHSVSWD